jgi:hypothetical protein
MAKTLVSHVVHWALEQTLGLGYAAQDNAGFTNL